MHLLPVDAHHPRIGPMDAGDDFHHRAFASAVLAGETMDLAGVQREVDISKRLDAAKRLRNVSQFEQRHRASKTLDKELLLHPQHAVGVGLGDDRPVGYDVLGNAGAGLCALDHGLHAGDDRPAMDAAGWIANGGVHVPILHRLDRRRHRIDPTDLGLRAALRLHDLVGGERHVVIVEERRVDLRIFGEQRLPDARDLGHAPVASLLVETLVLREFRAALGEPLRPPLGARVAERALGHRDRAFAVDGVTSACVTAEPMNTLSGARKVRTLIVSSGAISVSMSMTGMPASIILLTGAVNVPMPKAWIATKSHFWEAMLSIAARCFCAASSPSNQVTSTLNSLPQYSAACLPCAPHVA